MIDRLKERMTLQLEAVCDCADLLTLIPHLWCTLIGEVYRTRGSLTLIKGILHEPGLAHSGRRLARYIAIRDRSPIGEDATPQRPRARRSSSRTNRVRKSTMRHVPLAPPPPMIRPLRPRDWLPPSPPPCCG